MSEGSQKIKNIAKRGIKKALRILLNWHLWFCVGLAWIVTNGWSYILLGIGTYLDIEWMIVVAGAYLAFLWLPFTPEKIVTAILSILLLKLLFPKDEKTLALLYGFYQKAKAKWKNRKKSKKDKKDDSYGS